MKTDNYFYRLEKQIRELEKVLYSCVHVKDLKKEFNEFGDDFERLELVSDISTLDAVFSSIIGKAQGRKENE